MCIVNVKSIGAVNISTSCSDF